MIRVISDNGKVFEAENAAGLASALEEVFVADPREGVLATYVLSRQPVSKRAIEVAEEEPIG